MRMALRVLVGLAGLLFVFLGLQFWLNPAALAGKLGVSPVGELGLATIRADMAAFFGVGAYAVYFVSPESAAANALVALGAGMIAAAVCALVIGAFVCLTRGFYFIMVTLAAAQMMYSLFHDTDIAKGSDGAYVNVKPDLVVGATTLLDFDDRKTFYYVCLALLVVTVLALFKLARTPFGRIVQSLKANETRQIGRAHV